MSTDFDAQGLVLRALATPNARKAALMAAAANGAAANLFTRAVDASAATIASPSSPPTVTGLTNVLGDTSGFVQSSALTANAAAGSPILTGVSSTSTIKIGAPVLEIPASTQYLPSYIPLGAVVIAFDSTTITLSKPAIGTATGLSFKTLFEGINLPGSVPGTVGATSWFPIHATTGNQPPSPPTGGKGSPQGAGIIEFMTDAANFGTSSANVIFFGFRNGLSSPKYRIAIDDVYQTTDPQSFDASIDWITIQLLSAGIHKVRIELAPGFVVKRIYVTTGALVWKPSPKPIVGFFGDSWFSTGLAGSWAGRNMAAVAAGMLGVDPFFCSVAGTGYVKDGTSNFAWSSDYRIADTRLKQLDAIVIYGSINDKGQSGRQAAALLTWQKLRAANPKIPISIFGVGMTGTSAVTASDAAFLEADQIAAFAQWGDRSAWYHPVQGNGLPVLTTANIGTYIGADANHPADPIGANYLGRWMAGLIAADWSAWVP